MIEPSSRARELAARVIEQAIRGMEDAKQQASAMEQVFASFHGHMSTLVGEAGVVALQTRALHLTQCTNQCTGVTLGPAGYVVALHLAEAQGRVANMATLQACAVLLLAYNIHLVASFIGEDLTERLLLRASPQAFDASWDEGGQGT